jgi:predicted N-formylglutamate amidohydrolase
VAVALYTTREGHNPLLLISVHEGRHIPEELHDGRGRPLGIEDPSDLERHIALDLGIGDVTALLADATGAHVFRVTHSRLVADLNRFDDELECIAPEADGTEIPLNKALTDQQRSARLARFYFPVLEALNAFVADVARNAGTEPFVLSMHSYARTQKTTPTPKREDVCVFGYPEFGPSPKLERFVQHLRDQTPALVIGNNRPFSARTLGLRTAEGDPRMACPVTYFNVVQRNNVLNHFCLEICQDLLETADARRRITEQLSHALAAAVPLPAWPGLVGSDRALAVGMTALSRANLQR